VEAFFLLSDAPWAGLSTCHSSKDVTVKRQAVGWARCALQSDARSRDHGGMKILQAVALTVGTMVGAGANAQTAADKTPVTQCDELPYSASISVFSRAETTAVCREVLRILEGVTVVDLQFFERAAYMFSAKGYEERNYKQITAELVDIIRLRGLYDKPARWQPTTDLVFKSYVGLNGIVTPRDVEQLLSSAGPMAKTLSDDGLLSMIVLIKH
jgi:hypothetical protein